MAPAKVSQTSHGTMKKYPTSHRQQASSYIPSKLRLNQFAALDLTKFCQPVELHVPRPLDKRETASVDRYLSFRNRTETIPTSRHSTLAA